MLAEGRLEEAARYTDRALRSEVRAPDYLLRNQRGRILMAQGSRAEALKELRDAVNLASGWRVGVLPASASLTATNRGLEQKVFLSFVEAAADEAVRTGDRRWAEEAFEAMELNRAASLRESLTLADAWRRKAPGEYWEKLGRLRQVDSKVLAEKPRSEESQHLRLELAEIEAKSGLGFSPKNSEIFRGQSSLIHFQHGLGRSEVLLSFHLGNTESYRWELTRNSFRLRRIAAKGKIRQQILAFSEALRSGRTGADELGEELYKELFADLGQEAAAGPSWLMAVEGTLFQLPFAALVTGRTGTRANYLVTKHSVQTIPGALLLSTLPELGTGWFLGIGDPVYNVADLRWRKSSGMDSFLGFFRPAKAFGTPTEFGRLVGSDAELRSSASSWAGPAVLLEGMDASRARSLDQVSKSPALVHLATHVVSSGNTAMIALSLNRSAEVEFLKMAEVASLHVPGAIVAMTGCDTGGGEVMEGAGLLGLTRAWEMAGAGAVVATSWPVLDSSGDILSLFYKNLRHYPAAEALRRSQMEMLNSAAWQARPSYWAAYQITGGAR